MYTKEHNCENFIKLTMSKNTRRDTHKIRKLPFPQLKTSKNPNFETFFEFLFGRSLSAEKGAFNSRNYIFQAEISSESEFSDCGKKLISSTGSKLTKGSLKTRETIFLYRKPQKPKIEKRFFYFGMSHSAKKPQKGPFGLPSTFARIKKSV